jgi:hypothetical protein
MRRISHSGLAGDFERAWRRLAGGYRLHPNMIPYKWKPGQSGNPAGSSAARRTAARDIAEGKTVHPAEQRNNPASPGTERMRRWRKRKQLGVVNVNFIVCPDVIDNLIRLGCLQETRRGERDSVEWAIIQLAGRAIAMGITRARGQ